MNRRRCGTLLTMGLLTMALASGAAPGREESGAQAATLADARSYTATLVGHAHIDLAWLWRWEDTVRSIAPETFSGTLAQMAKVPSLTFAQSQAALYDAMEKRYPALFESISKKVREGTWIPVGGTWAEPDLNMPDGESLARQFLYGKRYFLDKFGVDVTVGWSPDAFGHSWQLPQVMRRAGITDYVLERCAPEKTPFFWWQGKDGSRVFSYVPPGWYNVSLRNGLGAILAGVAGDTPVKDFMILYGAGDHGGGPRASDLAAVAGYRDDAAQPKMVFGRPDEYFKRVRSEKADFPLVNRELNFTFPACYTTQVEEKKWNRSSESLLLEAERISGLAVASGYRDYYPALDIDEAWKTVLRNQFHDILDGSSIGPVYEEAGRFYEEASERARRARDFSLETILDAVDTRGEGVPVAVFNSLAWERTDVVTAEVDLPGAPDSLGLVDSDGGQVPVQVLQRKAGQGKTGFQFVFLAGKVPSLGYRIYRAVPASKPAGAARGGLAATPDSLENEFFRVELDKKTGWITSLVDKRTKKQVFTGPANVLQSIVDEPQSMSAWELGYKGPPLDFGNSGASLSLVEAGPVRSILRVTTPFRDSVFEQDLILAAGMPRIDCRTTTDWQERDLMVKLAFPVNVKADTAEFEIPFGSIARPADGAEVPALRWVDVSDAGGGSGFSLLNNAKYGFDVKGSVLRMSVIHGATYPDPEADRGRHEFLYSLYPHSGTWRDADTTRRGYELNYPLIVKTVMAHPGNLPAARGFVRAEPANVLLSTLKMASGYDSRSLVVRVYETQGRKTNAVLSFPWPFRAEETDLIERPLPEGPSLESQGEGNEVMIPVGAYEIRTFRITRTK